MPKRRCFSCNSTYLIHWGLNISGTTRYRCTACGATQTTKRKDTVRRNRKTWFIYWLKGSTIQAIAQYSRRSHDTIIRTIWYFLDNPPTPAPVLNDNCHLVIDATWFKKDHCLMVYWDIDLKTVQYWRYTTGEHADEIAKDLSYLKGCGVICASTTSDGGRGIVAAVRHVYPDIPHQRCIVHIQRYARALLTQNPKTSAGKQMSILMQQLSHIREKEEAMDWIGQVVLWEQKWKVFLQERTYGELGSRWWYTHRTLRKVRRLIMNALPNVFHYIDDPGIPHTSNGLEGRFSSLKQHYRQHRGLSRKRRNAYLSWYLTVVING
jgi:hypothetical protein